MVQTEISSLGHRFRCLYLLRSVLKDFAVTLVYGVKILLLVKEQFDNGRLIVLTVSVIVHCMESVSYMQVVFFSVQSTGAVIVRSGIAVCFPPEYICYPWLYLI
ncbi:hypothetical protein A2U01_0021115, partial [Trifolium medium]|nr:hypothetical protein [Trifolium medium]